MDDRGRPIPALDRDYPDIAVLEIDELDEHPCVSLDVEWPSYADGFQIFGYPLEGGAVQLTPARLTYRGTHGVRPNAFMDLASDTVKPGMSGAAVLNLRSGKVCGVIVASKHTAHPDGALAVPWAVIEPQVPEVMTANQAFHDRDRRWAEAAAVQRQRLRFRLPRTVAHFTGRDDLLQQLDSALDARKAGVIIQVISGLGGVGKTQLAAAFAGAQQDRFDIVAWVRADDGGTADLAELAVALGVPVSGRTPSERANEALMFLSNTDLSWLLVLDNVPGPQALQELPTSGRGRVLATSRQRGGYQDFGSELTVDVFDPDSALSYLLARSGRTDEARDARSVAAAVGCLPLALAHAGAYCTRDGGARFSEYLELLDSLPSGELYESNPEVFYQHTVAATWQPSITAAEQHAPLARHAIEMAAYLASTIPRSFFSVLDERSALGRKRISDALAALHRYSLASVTDNQVNVHRLLQKVVRDQLSNQADTTAAAHALAAVEDALPTDDAPGTWPQWQELIPHVTTLGHAGDVADIDAARLLNVLNQTCSFLIYSEAHSQAQELAERTVAISSRLLGPQDPNTFIARQRLGDSYRREDPVKAIAIYKPLVADSQHILGRQAEFTLNARNALGDAYRYAESTARAIKILQPLVADYERIFGPDDEGTMSARNNLALSYTDAGRLAEALTIMEELASSYERVYGPDSPSALIIRMNLAAMYGAAGREAEARAMFEQLLAESESILGPDNYLTVQARQWLYADDQAAQEG
jgi:tetratricopeptide (TPR) repeat protein